MAYFTRNTFSFLEELTANNDRDWFQANKARYERDWLAPSLAFIGAMQRPLKKVAPFLVAKPSKVGGSLMRIYRDSRFSKDKTPYKTNIGIQFRHDAGKDIHAPGFYVHLAADECFIGAGVWHPDAPTLAQIRAAIDENQKQWSKVKSDAALNERFEWWGESLKTPPRGYAADHPWIDDLKRKDHLVLRKVTRDELLGGQVIEFVSDQIKAAKPLMRFLCMAIKLPY